MRIVLHAGLHKSGTTHVQDVWSRAYADHPTVWFPLRAGNPLPHHHYLTWGLLRAFTAGGAPDLVGARLTRAHRLLDLGATVAEAEARGIEALVISSEDLDRITEDDVPGVRTALGEHPVTVVITATRPMHRWCSTWQTMVKRGLGDYPRDAAPMVEDLALLGAGRLERLLRLLPASERVVRLVRPSPPEPALARELALAVGLADPGAADGGASNPSLGVDIEVVRRINAHDLAMGTTVAGREILARLRGDGFVHEDDATLAARYEPSAAMWDGARVEQAFLADPPSDLGLRVEDPLDLLPGWCDSTPPSWYDQISRRHAVLPGLDAVPGGGPEGAERLWRVRQERDALAVQLAAAQQQARRRARRVRELEADRPARGGPATSR